MTQMGTQGTGYYDRRRDRSEGTVRTGSVWPIGKAGFYPGPSAARGSRKNHFTKNSVTPADDLLLDAAMRCDIVYPKPNRVAWPLMLTMWRCHATSFSYAAGHCDPCVHGPVICDKMSALT